MGIAIANTDKDKLKLGRLRSFGIEAHYQVPLLLPKSYDDIRRPIAEFEWLVEGDRLVLQGRLASPPTVTLSGTPMLKGYLVDGRSQRVGFTFFGDTRTLQEKFATQGSAPLLMLGTIKRLGEILWLTSPELIDPSWKGRLRPLYPSLPRVITADTVRNRLAELLPGGIPQAAQWIWRMLCGSDRARRAAIRLLNARVGGPLDTEGQIDHLLRVAHGPNEPREGLEAQGVLERLAALALWVRMEENRRATAPSRFAQFAPLGPRIAALPFELSVSQRAAVDAIALDIHSGRPLYRMISGDVGSGKSAVLGLAIAGVVDAGGRAFLVAPSQTLAEQLYKDFITWWPDLALRSALAVGGKAESAAGGDIIVGTTALLYGEFGQADLVVVDEQHKFSVQQREQLVGTGCHLLEATATCIPRTQALARYGAIDVSILKNRVQKTIHTRIWGSGQSAELWRETKATLQAGHQLLVIYPTRSDDAEKDDLPSAEAAAARWERVLPGRVGLAHAGRSDAENLEVLRRMRAGELKVLISTVLVEVGINIPGLRRVVVMHAERFGLTQLHQIRGRAARAGGEGWFDLVLPRQVGDGSLERLQVLERVSDGFEVAQEDLRLRGFGDLGSGSERQTGSDGTFLFGRGVNVDFMDEMLDLVAEEGP